MIFSMKSPIRHLLSILSLSGLVVLVSGCAMFFPDRSAPKSESYTYQEPNSPWNRIAAGSEAEQAARADVAFENHSNGAIISLNSICRKYQKYSLDQLTNDLLLKITNKRKISDDFIQIDGTKAKNSVYLAQIDGVDLKIRTVVLKKNNCMYDFMYVVVPDKDTESQKSFEQFLASFRVE